VPGGLIRQLAHDYARADRAQICWTLGITEHHNAADNVFALINLALLTGHVGRYGSGLVPLRGQNNVQGGGDMGAIPNSPCWTTSPRSRATPRSAASARQRSAPPPRP
jgi:predicted molibdopterin-dependent oxidoreductase YjgC